MLLYLGGALGVNTWLMKGFFDTVPRELDESAKVDGASHAQVVLPDHPAAGHADPRGGRVLAFIGTINEFLMASVFLTETEAKTLAVGLRA